MSRTKTTRKFGVEIETVGLTRAKTFQIFDELKISIRRNTNDNSSNCPRCGLCVCGDCLSSSGGCSCGWTGVRRGQHHNSWDIHYDGSIRDRGEGEHIELVSPILSGMRGLDELYRVASALKANNITANTSCGLHVHVDARDLNLFTLTNVVQRYAKFEKNIDSFMPTQRSRNSYCRSISVVAQDITRAIKNYKNSGDGSFITAFLNASSVYNHGRYRKVNLCAYLRHGTIEFRQHEGTIDPKTITNWVYFCVNFVEQSKVDGRTNVLPKISDKDSPFKGLPTQIRKFYFLREKKLSEKKIRSTPTLPVRVR